MVVERDSEGVSQRISACRYMVMCRCGDTIDQPFIIPRQRTVKLTHGLYDLRAERTTNRDTRSRAALSKTWPASAYELLLCTDAVCEGENRSMVDFLSFVLCTYLGQALPPQAPGAEKRSSGWCRRLSPTTGCSAPPFVWRSPVCLYRCHHRTRCTPLRPNNPAC